MQRHQRFTLALGCALLPLLAGCSSDNVDTSTAKPATAAAKAGANTNTTQLGVNPNYKGPANGGVGSKSP